MRLAAGSWRWTGALLLALVCACDDEGVVPGLDGRLEAEITFSVQRMEAGRLVALQEPEQIRASDQVTAVLAVTNAGAGAVRVRLAEWSWGPVTGPPQTITVEQGPALDLPPGGRVSDTHSFTIPASPGATSFEVRWTYESPDTAFVRSFGVAPG